MSNAEAQSATEHIGSVDLSGKPGWEEFDAPALVGDSLRFVSGEP
ncbi:MAG: PaaI family thioesterase, partial [Geobacteraceae bacterium]|nr:PaaI family thioesterase [Geobacteraceae bacterium]